jgi:hypothetical protein
MRRLRARAHTTHGISRSARPVIGGPLSRAVPDVQRHHGIGPCDLSVMRRSEARRIAIVIDDSDWAADIMAHAATCGWGQ